MEPVGGVWGRGVSPSLLLRRVGDLATELDGMCNSLKTCVTASSKAHTGTSNSLGCLVFGVDCFWMFL